MWVISLLSDNKVGSTEVEHQIHEGGVLFVFLALVGAVALDYYLTGIRFNGIARFSTNLTPIFILCVIFVNYLLIKLKIIDQARFSLNSYTSYIVCTVSILYISFVKTNTAIKEDERNASNNI